MEVHLKGMERAACVCNVGPKNMLSAKWKNVTAVIVL
jgi:hypothetical protein